MNSIFICVMCLGLSLIIFKYPEHAFDTLITGSTKAINLSLKLLAIYAIWLSVLEIVQQTQLDKKISKLLNPIINMLFKNVGNAKNDIALNITTNIFGMGNACTPSGINAMQKLYNGSAYITASMAMLFILNVTSLEILPSTVIGLRISAGSSFASSIIIPTLIATFSSTFVGIVLTKLLYRKRKK